MNEQTDRPGDEVMDELTLSALKASIVKWEHRAHGNYLRANALNCPLCTLFIRATDREEEDCAGCPVFAQTGHQYCEGTPCEEYFDNEMASLVAEREVFFLKSLLPSE